MQPDRSYYKNFTEEEFAADEYFQQWVLLPDDLSSQYWESYKLQFPQQQIAINNAFKLVQHLVITGFHIPFLTPVEKDALKKSIFNQISNTSDISPAIHSAGRTIKWWLLAAAVLTIIFTLRFINPVPAPENISITTLSETTQLKEIKKVLLPDSSIVILNGNSALHYKSDFATASVREVFLEGNAYFYVTKTTSLTPFIVHANDVRIYVTGTEFNVNARTNAAQIVLTRGKVNVTLEKDRRKTVYMQPGYMLDVDTLNSEFITTKINTELYTSAWNEGEWHFEGTKLETVSRLIKEYYGIEMIFTSPEQRNLMITAVVSVNDFSTLIKVIEKTLNINIQSHNQQLFIINPQSKQL